MTRSPADYITFPCVLWLPKPISSLLIEITSASACCRLSGDCHCLAERINAPLPSPMLFAAMDTSTIVKIYAPHARYLRVPGRTQTASRALFYLKERARVHLFASPPPTDHPILASLSQRQLCQSSPCQHAVLSLLEKVILWNRILNISQHFQVTVILNQ